ncbi:PilZ domain-containing protein [Methylocystis sp. WRRC1]|uniref:PilZ domain-containing protein n=1 Tax=Methylocystis sp. WRRC1 TaxID=1732014 RepID=UPI001D147BE9|nr:PilZ domain-containing protein [Methylocystis sp. WRRC1]MCC3245487.1 PilZ domain-containing protein [Methylocystis sp. WRRC1]
MKLSPPVSFMGVNLLHSIAHFTTNRFRRVQVSLHGRYMLKSSEEYPCHTFEISPGEASLFAPVKAMPGEKVVLYLRDLGRFAGLATRATEIGFEMSLQLSPKKRERLADQLTWYANRSALAVDERRRHERIVPLMELTVLRLARGDEHIVRIRSLSLSGVALETELTPLLGEQVVIGNTPATVVRFFDDGLACEFVTHFRPGEIDETTRL